MVSVLLEFAWLLNLCLVTLLGEHSLQGHVEPRASHTGDDMQGSESRAKDSLQCLSCHAS